MIEMIKKFIKKLIPKSILYKIQFIRNEKNRRKPQKSYSQAGEDRIIQILLNIIRLEKLTYIDIGAYDPYFISNTALLYEQGCRGINVEPNPISFHRFQLQRVKDINLNIGIASQKALLNYYAMENDTLNTFSQQEAELYQQKNIAKISKIMPIEVTTITEIIQKYANNIFPDILSLDVEGLDEEILRSINYQVSCPKIICVETQNFAKGIREENIIDFLQTQEYKIFAETGLNTIFVKTHLIK
jgi:FkbM family methyltransferase